MRAVKAFVLPLSAETQQRLKERPGMLLAADVLLVALPVVVAALLLWGLLGVSGPLVLAVLVGVFTFGIRILPVSPTASPSTLNGLDPRAQMVVVWLRGEGERRYHSARQVAEALHMEAGDVEEVIDTLRDSGLVASTADGSYHRAT